MQITKVLMMGLLMIKSILCGSLSIKKNGLYKQYVTSGFGQGYFVLPSTCKCIHSSHGRFDSDRVLCGFDALRIWQDENLVLYLELICCPKAVMIRLNQPCNWYGQLIQILHPKIDSSADEKIEMIAKSYRQKLWFYLSQDMRVASDLTKQAINRLYLSNQRMNVFYKTCVTAMSNCTLPVSCIPQKCFDAVWLVFLPSTLYVLISYQKTLYLLPLDGQILSPENLVDNELIVNEGIKNWLNLLKRRIHAMTTREGDLSVEDLLNQFNSIWTVDLGPILHAKTFPAVLPQVYPWVPQSSSVSRSSAAPASSFYDPLLPSKATASNPSPQLGDKNPASSELEAVSLMKKNRLDEQHVPSGLGEVYFVLPDCKCIYSAPAPLLDDKIFFGFHALRIWQDKNSDLYAELILGKPIMLRLEKPNNWYGQLEEILGPKADSPVCEKVHEIKSLRKQIVNFYFSPGMNAALRLTRHAIDHLYLGSDRLMWFSKRNITLMSNCTFPVACIPQKCFDAVWLVFLPSTLYVLISYQKTLYLLPLEGQILSPENLVDNELIVNEGIKNWLNLLKRRIHAMTTREGDLSVEDLLNQFNSIWTVDLGPILHAKTFPAVLPQVYPWVPQSSSVSRSSAAPESSSCDPAVDLLLPSKATASNYSKLCDKNPASSLEAVSTNFVSKEKEYSEMTEDEKGACEYFDRVLVEIVRGNTNITIEYKQQLASFAWKSLILSWDDVMKEIEFCLGNSAEERIRSIEHCIECSNVVNAEKNVLDVEELIDVEGLLLKLRECLLALRLDLSA